MPLLEHRRSPALPSTSKRYNPAIAAAGADGHLTGAIRLPDAFGAQHYEASPVRIAPCGSPCDSTPGQLLLAPLPGYAVPVLA